MTPKTTFRIDPRGAFSLEMIRTFQCGLMSASRACSADPNEVAFAFPLDGTFAPVGVRLRVRGAAIEGEAAGSADAHAIARQVARILSVDHDGRGFQALVARDPVLRAAYAQHPGFRPPIFYSPYAAAGWLVLTQRLRREQAASVQRRLAEAGGDVIELDGQELASFPRPETILGMSHFAGVPDEKWHRLQAVARAALEGELELKRLTSMPYDDARERLRRIHGIGPWTADGILMRGCGLADALTLEEPQLHHAIAAGYGLRRVPSDAEVAERAEAWRPYRAWCTVLLVMTYFRRTAAPVRARGTRRPSQMHANRVG